MTNHGCMTMVLKPNLRHTNGSVLKSQNRKKHAYFGQTWRFFSLFYSFAIVHHKFLPYGRTVTKKYYLARSNSSETHRIVEKKLILHHNNALAHTSMLVRELLVKTKTVIIPQQPLGRRWSFPLPKTEGTDERKVLLRFRRLKKNRNTSCWQYQKARFRSFSRIWKIPGLRVICLEAVTLKGTR